MTPKKLITLSETDVATLSEMAREHRTRYQNDRVRTVVERDQSQAPDVYIGLTSHDGIPGLLSAPGTGTYGSDDTPGVGECDIFRIDWTTTPHSLVYCGFSRDVYNLSTDRIGPVYWVLLAKEKFGSWIITDVLADSESAGTFTVREVDGAPSTTNTLIFPNNSLYDNLDGTLTVHIATAGVTGLVSAISASNVQSFIGIKEISTMGGAFRVPWGVVGHVDFKVITPIAFGSFGGLNGNRGPGTDEYYAGWSDIHSAFGIGARYIGSGIAINTKYAIEYNGGAYTGVTGTGGGGDTVIGGIVTTLGSAIVSFTDELAQDAVGTICADSATIDFDYNDGTPSITAAAIYQMSITADASGLKLSGDSASPGNDYFYGTDAVGTKGWYAVPVASVTDTATVDLTLTGSALSADVIKQMSITSDASGLKLDGDASSPGNSYYYGTNGTGTKGFYTLPPDYTADAELNAIAGLTSAADLGIMFTGSGTASTYSLTAAGLALLDDADASAQRTTLGLGTMAQENIGVASFGPSAVTSITVVNGVITAIS